MEGFDVRDDTGEPGYTSGAEQLCSGDQSSVSLGPVWVAKDEVTYVRSGLPRVRLPIRCNVAVLTFRSCESSRRLVYQLVLRSYVDVWGERAHMMTSASRSPDRYSSRYVSGTA